jgi:hypothetical protein
MSDVSTSEIDGSPAEIVNVIMLYRIYDTLLCILSELGGDASALGKLHESGQFIGPNPAVSIEEEEDGSGE